LPEAGLLGAGAAAVGARTLPDDAHERDAGERQENDRYYAYERSYGTFSRSFTLPEGGDVEHCDADLKHGVLTVSVPKKPEHQPKRISLKGIGDKVKGALGGKDKGQA
jgi:hypothetical protein